MRQIIIFLLFGFILLSCEKKQEIKSINIKSEKAIVEETIKNTIGWVKHKDTSLLYSIIADDSNYLEVHPGDNVVKGINQFKEAERFWLDPRFEHVSFETWEMHINISQDGTVAWYYCMLNDLNNWDEQPVNWENTRWTGVLEKRNGKWRMVQMHFSYPAE
ncbi:nuclear transport factor 2 family protein [Bacteroidota bacterium]